MPCAFLPLDPRNRRIPGKLNGLYCCVWLKEGLGDDYQGLTGWGGVSHVGTHRTLTNENVTGFADRFRLVSFAYVQKLSPANDWCAADAPNAPRFFDWRNHTASLIKIFLVVHLSNPSGVTVPLRTVSSTKKPIFKCLSEGDMGLRLPILFIPIYRARSSAWWESATWSEL